MKVLGILNRKFMPCTAIELRFQKLRPYKKKKILLLFVFWWRTSRCARDRQTFNNDIRQAELFFLLFIVSGATCFYLLIRSSSGLLTTESKDAIYVLGSQHAGIPTRITSFDSIVRRPDDVRISRSKHVASHIINNNKNGCAWRIS